MTMPHFALILEIIPLKGPLYNVTQVHLQYMDIWILSGSP